MKLMIVDFSHFPLNFETEELAKQLNKNVTIYTDMKHLYKDYWYYDLIKEYSEEEFIQDQASHDAVYVIQSYVAPDLTFKISYFYNIYSHTWNSSIESNYQSFEATYSKVNGASAVFVNDKKINKFSNWLGLNSYYLNKPVDTYTYPYIRSRKFFTPKLNIGFIPSSKLFDKENPRNKIVEDMWSCAKNNWVLHLPNGDDLDVPEKNVVRYSVVNGTSSLDYREMYKNCQVIINPEDFYYDGVDFSHDSLSYNSMSMGCVTIKPNQQNTNSDYFFDKVHYFKMDYIDSNTLVNLLRYADKRREKLERVSKEGSKLIQKYFDVRSVVQQKLQIMKNNI